MRASAGMGRQVFSERAAMASQCIAHREALRAGVVASGPVMFGYPVFDTRINEITNVFQSHQLDRNES
ncbi:hypothetical protein DF034_23490 [Burkholderia anthina]|nr:hypothetical protein DF034_23490 [Burkholderia anthina]